MIGGGSEGERKDERDGGRARGSERGGGGNIGEVQGKWGRGKGRWER